MKRTAILLLDSFGLGGADDAASFKDITALGHKYDDVGSNTLANIAKFCAEGKSEEGRTGSLKIPNLNKLGIGKACYESSGVFPLGLDDSVIPAAAYGCAKELSTGKDTSSGHWEIAGVPVTFEWGYFRDKKNSFPKELLDKIVERAGLRGYIGNCHASGTQIIAELGDEHISSKKPIIYTSADSVVQIACHEESFGLENLYKLCKITREILDEDDYNIGRVIARPFTGNSSDNYKRTNNRHDYSQLPPAPTLLDKMKNSGGNVISVGKISDIFAAQGITKAVPAFGIDGLFDASLEEFKNAKDQTILFTNFVNFDADFGHRRNVSGYASALEYFDQRLPEFLDIMQEGDLLIITADHGCDPTWSGTDHTREHIPVIAYAKNIAPISLGQRDTFADIGQSIAEHHNLEKLDYGKSFL